MITVHVTDYEFGDRTLDINVDEIVQCEDGFIAVKNLKFGTVFYRVKETRGELSEMIANARYDRYTLLAEALRNMGVGC